MSSMSQVFGKTQKELNHHIAAKHPTSYADAKTKYSSCEKEFPSCYSLQKHKQSERGKWSQAPDVNVNLDSIKRDHRDPELRE